MADAGIHEIQLKGKQLVFLFMVATVVAVVIFLCGVMVGRGVPVRATSVIDTPEQASFDARGDELRAVSIDSSAPPAGQEILTYPPLLLDDPDPPSAIPEPVVAARPAPAAPRPVAVNSPTVASAPTPTPTTAAEPRPAPAAATPPVAAPPTAADATLVEPPGTGFVVQVAAVRQRDEANAMARRLSAKGYPAFVTVAGPNFRVRVGKYDDRGEAESVAGRLETEDRFMSWITR